MLNQNNYILNKRDRSLGKWVGNITRFADSIHFESFNHAPCGIDCFTHTYGRYRFEEKDKVAFYLDSITWSGECKKPTEHINGSKSQTLFVAQKKDTLVFFVKKLETESRIRP
jgi:hypothetical protein